jgi:REP element-mobilizing transposase RayT
MQKLEGRTARFVLKALRESCGPAWCGGMLSRWTLPPSVHDEAHFRVGERRFYDMNIWSDKKQLEKLNYMHHNPVKRGLVKEPGNWPWSSWRFYFLDDASILRMDRRD